MITEYYWPQGTIIQLCNVPFDASYRNIWGDASKSDIEDYFSNISGETITLSTRARVRPLEPVVLPIPYDSISCYNYLHVKNEYADIPYQRADARLDYYYFITSATYLAPNSTQLTLQLDVMTTFCGEYHIGQSYLERGHEQMRACPTVEGFLANPRGANGLDVPEGLDHGADYVTAYVKPFSAQDNDYIVITASADLFANPGEIANANLNASTGGWYNNVPSGQTVYIIKGSDYARFCEKASAAPWVSQCISSMQCVNARMLGDVQLASKNVFGVIACYVADGEDYGYSADDYIDVTDLPRLADERYKSLTKLYAYPYTAYTLNDNCGQTVVYRPEMMQSIVKDGGMRYVFATMGAYAPPNVRLVVWPLYYGAAAQAVYPTYSITDLETERSVDITYPTGDFTSNALVLASWPSFSLTTNSYAAYLASTYFTRNYAYSSADWSQIKAKEAAELARSTGYGEINTASNQQALANRTALANAGTDLAIGAAGMAVGAAGGAVGLAGATAGAINAVGSMAKLNTNINAANEGLAITQQQQYNVLDSNYAYQMMASTGDYQQSIAAINATVQDARLTPPASVGNAGGEGFMWGHGFYGYFFNVIRIRETYVRIIGDYFLRYGYAAHRWITGIDTLNICTHFTYWKLSECNLIASNIPENYKDVIRGVFERGVTVWRDPRDINTITIYDNEVIR